MQFLGVVPHDIVPSLLAAADVAVAPSVHDDAGNVDGLPNTVMEIMASGTPLVATPAGGIGTIATDRLTARLVPERDVRSLAAAVDGLLRDRPAAHLWVARRAISCAGTTAGCGWLRTSKLFINRLRPDNAQCYRVATRHCISAGSGCLSVAYCRPLEARNVAGGGARLLGGHHQRHHYDYSGVWPCRTRRVFAGGARGLRRRTGCSACSWVARESAPGAAPPARWTAAIPLVLIAAGVWMYFAAPAAEYVMGGRDPGVYISEGIQIAQRQSLVTTDRVAAAVPASARDLFFPSYSAPSYYSIRFMGFPLRDPESGTVTGQFPQGYPIWIAIAYGLDGVTGTRRVTAWWAILGVLTVYFAALRLVGPLPAAVAAGLLCVHVIQTWYARYPNSEIVTQALVFSALLAHAYAHEDDDRFFGAVAASLLGLALFTRLPAVLVVGVAIAASLLPYVKRCRGRVTFLVTLSAWSIAAGAYYATQLGPYMGLPISYARSRQPILLVFLAAVAAALSALLWASRKPRAATAMRTLLPTALIAIVLTFGLYALFLREPGGLLAPHDAHALRIFASLYFTPIGFGLALAGYALLVWRSFWRAPALILVVTALAMVFFYKVRIWPEHFWLARRFLTEILPGALIFASAAMFAPVWMKGSWLDSRRSSRVVFTVVGVLAAVLLGLPLSVRVVAHSRRMSSMRM